MDGLKIVPQLFYDLIARVIPGSVAILAIASAVKGKTDWTLFKVIPESILTSVMILLTTGYVIGHLIVPLSDYLKKKMSHIDFRSSFHLMESILISADNRLNLGSDFVVLLLAVVSESWSTKLKDWMKDKCIFRRAFQPKGYGRTSKQLWKLKDFLDKEIKGLAGYGTPGVEGLGKHDDQYTDILFLWYDWLRVKDPEVGGRLTKLRAEHEMHKGIAVAILSASIVGMGRILWTKHATNLDIELLIVTFTGFLLCALGMAKTYWRFQISTISHYFIAKQNA
jgi:hypothetical protein